MLVPASPGWVSLPVVVGVPRHSWLRVPGRGSPPLLAGVRRRWWCAAPRHSWLGPAGCCGVFRGWGCPLLCVFVVCVGVRGGRAVLCVACLWCLRFWWCGVVVRWVCLPRVLVCVLACVWCASGLRFGVPAPCLSWPCPLGPLLRNILGLLIYACVAVDMICRMHGAVTYLFVIPLFSRGPWSCFIRLWLGVSPFVVFPSFFFFTRTSRLVPTARTLLGGLEHAMFIFFAVAARLFLVFASIHLLCCWSAHKSLAPRTRTWLGALGQAMLFFVTVGTLLFFFFCECPKFCNLAKQRRKIFLGVSEVGKIDFALYLFRLCVFFLVFLFFCCDRATRLGLGLGFQINAHLAWVYQMGDIPLLP